MNPTSERPKSSDFALFMQSPTSPRNSGKMMSATRSRPASQHGVPSAAASGQTPVPVRATRKVFNCIVDESALVAGVKKSTRNGIRQWVKNGQIRLYVPLHALEQLGRHRSSKSRHGDDVRETLKWLDEATSMYPGAVKLQEPDETYHRWSDVERYAVPRGLFSENDGVDEFEPEEDVALDEPLIEEGIDSLVLDDKPPKTPVSSAGSVASGLLTPESMKSQRSVTSAMSPPTSPAKPVKSSVKPIVASTKSGSFVPRTLQPLFNYIIWRIHQEVDPVAALESFIFLCNDPAKVNYAKGFEVKTKRLEQLREAISREDRDDKNRLALVNRENQNADVLNSPPQPSRIDEETGYVVPTSPPTAPAAMLSRSPRQSGAQTIAPVIDPNAFDRNAVPTGPSKQPTVPQSPRLQNSAPINNGRGQFSPRGNGRGNPRGGARGRGNGAMRGGPSSPNNNSKRRNTRDMETPPMLAAAAQIDPDSFSRPRGDSAAGRGGRKLWVPS